MAALALSGACGRDGAVEKARARVEVGDQHLSESKLAEALAAYRTALSAAPDHLPARIGVGRVEMLRGNVDLAIQEFRRVLEKDPNSAAAYAAWGEALWRTEKFAESAEKYARAVELDPESGKILAALAMAYAALLRTDEALSLFDRAAAKESELDASAYLFWGTALQRAGRRAEAIDKYEVASVRDPDEPTIQNNLGLLLVGENRDPARGAALLEQAAAKKPDDPTILYNLGWAYLQTGRVAEADDYLRRALGGSDPKGPEYAKRLETLKAAEAKLPRKAPPPTAPNVVLVVIDTLRADHLGAYGYPLPTSPNLDALAAQSVVFEQAISQAPWTAASVGSLFTSLHPSVHGLDAGARWGSGEPSAPGKLPFAVQKTLDSSLRTLAEVLRENGYRTVGFVSNVYLNSVFGFAQGFDVYHDEHGDYSNNVAGVKRRAAETNRGVFEWLEGKVEEPFFLFVHYNDPHWPYVPEPPFGNDFIAGYRGDLTPRSTTKVVERRGKPITDLSAEDLRYVIGLYDGEIQYVDAHLGELLDRLEARRFDRKTLTLVTADHGEEFLDHGSASHGYTLFEEQVRVPLLAHYPGRLSPRRVPAQVRLIDVLPTVLDLAGLEAVGGIQGVSVADLARGRSSTGPEHALSEASYIGDWKSLRAANGMKLLRSLGNGKSLLFDLSRDPSEKEDLSGRPEASRHLDPMDAALQAVVESDQELRTVIRGTEQEPRQIVLDRQMEEQLRQLGYIE